MRLQTGQFHGTIDCISKTIKAEGFLGLYKGMSSPLLASTLFTAIMFGSFETFKNFFLAGVDRHLTPLEFTIAACSTGLIETVFYTPFEHIKTKLQTHYDRSRFFSPDRSPLLFIYCFFFCDH